MTAYVIANDFIIDPVRYEAYKVAAPWTIALYGGHYLARGGPLEVKEGGWKPARLVLIEFPSAALARAWWGSVEFAEARAARKAAANTELVIFEGVSNTEPVTTSS